QKGNLLSRPERDQGLALSDTQLEYTKKLEQRYISRIEDILAPIVGMDGVRAQVVAEVDFTVSEQTHESFNPDLTVVRSEQIEEENRLGANGPLGVPGALSNQPPGGGVAPELSSGEAGSMFVSGQSGSKSKHSTRNYEIDRTISHTRIAPGSIQQLSVAVLVDERRTLDDEGNVQSIPLSEAEMTRINALIMDAIGFNKARGDSLNVVNAPFMAPPVEESIPALPIWEQDWVWNVVKQVLGGLLVLFLVFGVIRPAFKDLNKVPVSAAGLANDGMAPGQAIAMGAGGVATNEMDKITTGAEDLEGQLTNVRSLVQQDPALVAQVVKNWTASES
ncbi:MAG: flagellar M-ring protein FliF, partial [Gammaproteobacteria bacterium]